MDRARIAIFIQDGMDDEKRYSFLGPFWARQNSLS